MKATLASCSAKARTISAPMPVAPPGTNATLPARLGYFAKAMKKNS